MKTPKGYLTTQWVNGCTCYTEMERLICLANFSLHHRRYTEVTEEQLLKSGIPFDI